MTERGAGKTMAISGASGLVGSALGEAAAERGWSVVPLVRDREREGIYWSVEEEAIDVEAMEGVDAVVHLAGESVAGGRWSRRHKERILHSRERGTELVAGAVAQLADPPEVFVSASGSHFYGFYDDDRWVDEQSESGEGFLAEVCRRWEKACDPARQAGLRVVNSRFGVVLSGRGGALQKMLTPFRFGVGGRLGSGEQYMSWVHLDDVVRALFFVIERGELEGPVNVSSPGPVTNAEFTKALGDVLGRPTPFPVPAPVLKLAVGGQLATEVLLGGQRVRPKRLLQAGFEFQYPTVEEALAEAA